MSPANEVRKSKAERTSEAREKARLIREAQLKKDKRNKLLIGWGIVVAVVAILVVVGLVVTTTMRQNAPIADQGPTPANANIHGGVTLLAQTDVVKLDPATVDAASVGEPPKAAPAEVVAPGAEAEAGKPVKVVLYVDFICPVCKNFEAQYNQQLTSLRNEGKISVEYRVLGFLDNYSSTNYSSRAANAAACVVNESPEKYAEFIDSLFANQPAEGSAGLSDDKLKTMATDIGAKPLDSCVDGKTYRPFVKFASKEAAAIGVTGTPTVFVDGKQWGKGASAQTPFPDFLQAAITAKG
ncbi:thioredoxin domain-containing protein [Pseudarthrobacter sp. AL07]|uniref:DsbA family protein n=1 Tax=unclassified Pseudarthrobacter TaxID=2647000 RepID=UPI00249A4242|nr:MULTISPECIES: thioredoxin domain-containing protein [unclassified Pseudarthrobacter]MDI3196106.1 thioredoxin domain-containing protein [Pseudarthrobacter sp. AL20]MDI3210177.1 thioredoxin domain-containing protein [Pseudarthrobacter sp. AL07]